MRSSPLYYEQLGDIAQLFRFFQRLQHFLYIDPASACIAAVVSRTRQVHEPLPRALAQNQANSSEISKFGAECVNAPNEMKSTPVAATATSFVVSVPILPEASSKILVSAARTSSTALRIVA